MPKVSAENSMVCKCGAQMRVRDGKYGKFWGCSTFPKCRNTKPYDGEVREELVKDFEPSPFQETVFQFVKDGKGHGVVEGVAGCGKTTTITQGLGYTPKDAEVAFVAFNRHIANTLAGKAPPHVHVSTLHSLGFGNVRNALGNVKVEPRKIWHIVKDLQDEMDWDKAEAVDQSISSIIRLVNMCKATLSDPTDENLDWITDRWNIETNGDRDLIHTVVRTAHLESVADTATIDYDDMIWLCASGKVPCRKFDFLFVDETQDLNKAQLEMALKSVKPGGRIVAVGDHNQCVVDDSRILCYNKSISIQDISIGDTIKVGGGSGKLAEVKVGNVYRREVKDLPVYTVTTKSGKSLTTTPEHIYFAGFTQDQLGENWYFTYLMYKEGVGYRIGTTRMGRSNYKSPGFGQRLVHERADKIWLLQKCDTESKAKYWEQFYSVKFGLPTWLFHGDGRNLAYNEGCIERLFAEIDTDANAAALLHSLDMFIQYPHRIPKASSAKRRRNFVITIAADSRYKPLHHYAISGSDMEDAVRLRKIGINVRPSKKSKGWRLEGVTSNLASIYNMVSQIQSVMNINILEKARLSGRSLPFMPASHVRPGMKVFVTDGEDVYEDIVMSVSRRTYTGTLHDLNIDRYHNYAANGILTHNSIYGFRGADTDAMPNIIERLEATVLPLSITYRCPKSHVELAQTLVPEIVAAEWAEEGSIESLSEYSFLETVKSGDLVLCRCNAPLVRPAFSLIRQGVKAIILGRDIGKGLMALVKKVQKRYRVRSLDDTLNALMEYHRKEYARLNRVGKEMQAESLDDKIETLVALADGCDTVADLDRRVEEVFSDESAGVTFSTVHKAKGAEADRVFILKPGLMPHPKASQGWEMDQEANIIYVSLTRAKRALYFVGGHPPFVKMEDLPEVDQAVEEMLQAQEEKLADPNLDADVRTMHEEARPTDRLIECGFCEGEGEVLVHLALESAENIWETCPICKGTKQREAFEVEYETETDRAAREITDGVLEESLLQQFPHPGRFESNIYRPSARELAEAMLDYTPNVIDRQLVLVDEVASGSFVHVWTSVMVGKIAGGTGADSIRVTRADVTERGTFWFKNDAEWVTRSVPKSCDTPEKAVAHLVGKIEGQVAQMTRKCPYCEAVAVRCKSKNGPWWKTNCIHMVKED